MPLGFRDIDVLPAKEPGIDGPGTLSDHCQSGAQGGQNDGNRGIAGTREGDPHLTPPCSDRAFLFFGLQSEFMFEGMIRCL